MSRIVVVLQKTINGPSQIFLAEPSLHRDASVPMQIRKKDLDEVERLLQEMKSSEGNNDYAVKKVGTALLDMLLKHPAIRDHVSSLLADESQHEEPIYIYLKDRNPDLEQLPWEALYAPNVGFLSANKNFPIARAQKGSLQNSEWSFQPPLKMMAIMGASGGEQMERVSAREEWQSLYSAIKRSKADMVLRALLCEEDLKEEIDAEILAAGHDKWITTGLLQDRDQLFGDIHDFAPHILHFFCHGVCSPVTQLHVGSYRNWETGMPGGIRIESSQLKQRADPHGNVWLVTLNCCESAKSAEGAEGAGLFSIPMACSLVNSGFPAVVGMREQIAEDFAHDFCRLFYDALLDDFSDRIATAKREGVAEVHWACALFATRQRICEMIDSENVFSDVAARAMEWTIPVLYTRLETFRLRLISTTAGVRARQVQQLVEEMLQLVDDRRFLAEDMVNLEHLKPVISQIDARLADLKAECRV